MSSGLDGTKIWSLNKNDYFNNKCIKYFNEAQSGWNESVCKDKIIVQGNIENSLRVISIINMEVLLF